MSEIRIIEGKQADAIRLMRAQALKDLFAEHNTALKNALSEFLQKIVYDKILDSIKVKESERRERLFGEHDLAMNLFDLIKSEVEWGVDQSIAPKNEE